MKTVKVRLWRPLPPFVKSVTVGQITVAGFMELLRVLVSKAAEVRLQAGRDVVPEELIRSMREPEFNALADSVCKDEETGFFSRWLSLGNVTRLYKASFQVNNWERIFSCVDWSGKKKRKGSLVNDIQMLARFDPIAAQVIHDTWPMEFLLNHIDAMNLQTEQEQQPTPVEVLGLIPGVEIIH